MGKDSLGAEKVYGLMMWKLWLVLVWGWDWLIVSKEVEELMDLLDIG